MGDGTVLWAEMNRERIRILASRDPVLIQPIGAIEQHGPHLPVDTDTSSVTAMAIRTAKLLGPEQAIVLPTIQWGLSPYWLSFPGTITLRPETILALLDDIGRSVAAHGFRRMVILNGHGGNTGIVAVAATQMACHGIRAHSLAYWSLAGPELADLAPGDMGHIGHAGQTETSIQLHLRAELVDPGFAQITEWTDLGPLLEGLTTPGTYAPPLPESEAPNGIYGNAPAASADVGAQLTAVVGDRLAAWIRSLPKSKEQPNEN